MERIIPILIVAILEYSSSLSAKLAKLHNLRSDAWLTPSCQYLLNSMQKFKISNPTVQIIFLLFFFLAFIHLGFLLATSLFSSAGEVVFNTILLYYCLGALNSHLYSTDYIAMHEKCFGIIFWFSITGPLGTFLYWIVKEINLLDRKNIDDTLIVSSGLDVLHAVLAWIPARITGILFALVGNFRFGFPTWLSCMQDLHMPSSEVLNRCGNAACGEDLPESSAILVHRAFFMWIILTVIISF